jgi:hypothetical protein
MDPFVTTIVKKSAVIVGGFALAGLVVAAMISAARSFPVSPRKLASWRSLLLRSGSCSASAASPNATARRSAMLSAVGHWPTARTSGRAQRCPAGLP